MLHFFILDPLEQFDVINVFPFFMSCIPTNLNLVFFFNFLILFYFLSYAYFQMFFSINLEKSFGLVNLKTSSGFFNVSFWLFQKIFNLISDMFEENVILKKKPFILIVFFLFLFLLISNLIGMIPFSYTVTSSLVLTFFLSFSFFLGINLLGFYHNKISFFKTFLPGGTPVFIAPLLILIEVVSYFSRVFSLAIRLFANMMSGHALLKILIGFSWNALIAGGFWLVLSFVPWLVVSIVIGLELAIAFLQAYVFTILICIYINDAINPH